jgi:hypothetical protein
VHAGITGVLNRGRGACDMPRLPGAWCACQVRRLRGLDWLTCVVWTGGLNHLYLRSAFVTHSCTADPSLVCCR